MKKEAKIMVVELKTMEVTNTQPLRPGMKKVSKSNYSNIIMIPAVGILGLERPWP